MSRVWVTRIINSLFIDGASDNAINRSTFGFGNGSKAIFRTLGVSGTIKRLKRKFLAEYGWR
jgi:hypothetical protein